MNLSQSFSSLIAHSQVLNPVINKLVVSMLILLFGFIIGKLGSKLLYAALRQVETNATVKKWFKINLLIDKFVSSFFAYGVYVVSILFALDNLHAIPYVLAIVIGAVILVASMSLLLSIRDFLPNLLAGSHIKKARKFRVGNQVQVSSLQGKVVHIGFLSTELESANKERIFVPNAVFQKQKVIVKKN